MTPPKSSSYLWGPDPELGAGKLASKGGLSHPPLSTGVFDPEIFEELCDCLGMAQTCLALVELASNLQEMLVDKQAESFDRDKSFHNAHFFIARAGMLGFTALRDTCLELQHACATGASFSAEDARMRETAITTRKAILYLLQSL